MEHQEKIYNIIGAFMEVHNGLKPGLREQVYQEALMYEFQDRQIPYEREVYLPIQYKNRRLAQYYRMDFVCYGDVIVELKSVDIIVQSIAISCSHICAHKLSVWYLGQFRRGISSCRAL